MRATDLLSLLSLYPWPRSRVEYRPACLVKRGAERYELCDRNTTLSGRVGDGWGELGEGWMGARREGRRDAIGVASNETVGEMVKKNIARSVTRLTVNIIDVLKER